VNGLLLLFSALEQGSCYSSEARETVIVPFSYMFYKRTVITLLLCPTRGQLLFFVTCPAKGQLLPFLLPVFSGRAIPIVPSGSLTLFTFHGSGWKPLFSKICVSFPFCITSQYPSLARVSPEDGGIMFHQNVTTIAFMEERMNTSNHHIAQCEL
jgi:hypothetical protein